MSSLVKCAASLRRRQTQRQRQQRRNLSFVCVLAIAVFVARSVAMKTTTISPSSSSSSLECRHLETPVSITTTGDGTANDMQRSSSSSLEDEGVDDGPYAHVRAQLDHEYHDRYDAQRRRLQDCVVNALLNATVVRDHEDRRTCSAPSSDPWIVFTAGAMGAGKTHTMNFLHATASAFPLDAFVAVDPDEIRRHLPEYRYLAERNPAAAGAWTRKEAGYISEILTKVALDEGKNVLVDGSLRDHEWYKLYFQQLRSQYKQLRISILHVTAPRDVILERAVKRGAETGRIVPLATLEEALETVPRSVSVLRSLVDFFCELHNPSNDDGDIRIATPGVTWESFRKQWEQSCAVVTS